MATITVKHIPDDLYNRLKAAAETNRRSINREIISRIEQSLSSHRVATDQLLARVKRVQESYSGRPISIEQLDRAKREGRP